MGPAIPKLKPFRSQQLKDFAKDCPCCMYCKTLNVGQVVLAHDNTLRAMKGMGQKAHDIPCYLCNECHKKFDGEGGDVPWEERAFVYREGLYNSVHWLLSTGRLLVNNDFSMAFEDEF